MKSLGQDAARDLLLLSLTAGSADAIGYLGLGRVFTSNMTGNVVLLGISLGQGNFAVTVRILYVVAMFIAGACLGAWLGRNLPEKDWPNLAFRLIGLETISLLLFGIGWFLLTDRVSGIGSHALLALLAVAMGLQAAAMGRLSAPGVATTAVTGTITALATGSMNLLFMSHLPSDEISAARDRVRFQLGVVFLYCSGAAVAGFLIVHLPHFAGCFPVLVAALVAMGRQKA
jgi:uncharacterized membrane protein YoaK (UPF0700 family)